MKSSKTPRSSGAGPINILLDGSVVPVTFDTSDPSNTVAVPVSPFSEVVAKAAIASVISNVSYTELVASTATYINELEFISTMNMPLIIAFGAAASEVDKFYIGQDGLKRQAIAIPAGTRISVKALQAPTEGGVLLFNAFA